MFWYISFLVQIMVNNCWRIYLIMRQMKLCSMTQKLPFGFAEAMSESKFQRARIREMHNLEQLIWNQCVDLVFSCAELFLGLYPQLWQITIDLYEKSKDDTWIAMCFALSLTIYILLRYFPVLIYNYLVDDSQYEDIEDTENHTPLLGWICTFCFVIVFAQVFLAPATFIITWIADFSGYFFPFWTWLFVVTLGYFIWFFVTIPAIRFFGKEKELPDGSLRFEIEKVTNLAHFPISRVHILFTWYIHRGVTRVVGICCCQRLLIVDTLITYGGSNFIITTSTLFGTGLPDIEVAAMVAHSLGQWSLYHDQIVFLVIAFLLLIWFFLFGCYFYNDILFSTVGFENNYKPLIVGYVIGFKYALPLYMNLANFLLYGVLRWAEYRADSYVHKMGYGKHLSSAYMKCCANYGEFPLADRLYKMWYHREPTMLERISYLKVLESANIK